MLTSLFSIYNSAHHDRSKPPLLCLVLFFAFLKVLVHLIQTVLAECEGMCTILVTHGAG